MTDPNDQSHPDCTCKGFYRPPNCPIHGRNNAQYLVRGAHAIIEESTEDELREAMGDDAYEETVARGKAVVDKALAEHPRPDDMHNAVVDFGKHKGELWTRVPVQYLNWMVNAGHNKAHLAQAELTRRGSTIPDIEISPHAINRMTLKCMDLWSMYRRDGEGLHAWMVRNALEAIKNNRTDHARRYLHCRIRWVIDRSMAVPIVKTVMPRSPETEHADTTDRREAERRELRRGMLATLRAEWPESTQELDDEELWDQLMASFAREENAASGAWKPRDRRDEPAVGEAEDAERLSTADAEAEAADPDGHDIDRGHPGFGFGFKNSRAVEDDMDFEDDVHPFSGEGLGQD